MKQILTSKALRKLLILSCLVVGLVIVAASDNTQSVMARPCCQSCPGESPSEMADACADQTGSTSGPSYDECIYNGTRCWNSCYYCGTGTGPECSSNSDCNYPYYACIGGYCSNN